MDIRKLLRTVRYLKGRQIAYQLIHRLSRDALKNLATDKKALVMIAPPISGRVIWVNDDRFCFLNINYYPKSWNDPSQGMLWAYNLNYMDYILQPGVPSDKTLEVIEKFIQDLPGNTVGLDPYPIALRGINWIKWMAVHSCTLSMDKCDKINSSLYSQYELLEKKLEWHLMGNHLLEDAYSLTIGAIYFNNEGMWRKASRLLKKQLDEQILADGAHYEQSPMYHCILLERLLDVINISFNNPRFGESQVALNSFLKEKAARMLGHMENIVWMDGTIPLLNDSAYGIAPTPAEIKDYAHRLGLAWCAIPMKECGYRRMQGKRVEAIVDVGNIMASYQPGHSHADTFNYELRIDGHPFVVDTGISTYDKTPRRQHERSTSAHNTVVVGRMDSSEVWGGFRVGRRAKVKLICDAPDEVVADHDGFRSTIHRRRFEIDGDVFCVNDKIEGEGISLIHLAPDVNVKSVDDSNVVTDMAIIKIENAVSVNLVDEKVSTEYNRFRDIKVVQIKFNGRLTYKIIPNNI